MKDKGLHVVAKGETPAIYIYDEIGPSWMGLIDGKSVLTALASIGKAKEINVRVNSVGGDVWEGHAIYNALVGHPARIVVDVDGLAASAASVVSMAGDEIRVAANAMMMIHRASIRINGNAQELAKAIETLSRIDKIMADIYVARTKRAEEEIVGMMDVETWMTAQEAVDAKFATSVSQALKVTAAVPDGIYRNTPERFRTPAAGPARVAASAAEQRNKELRRRLGIR